METATICRVCAKENPPGASFCMQCGVSLSVSSGGIPAGRQAYIYIISALLPPFGLGWAIKYLRQKTPASKKVGITIIVITVVSLILNLWVIAGLYNQYFQLLNSISSLGV